MAKYKNTKQIAKSAKNEISDSKLHKYLIAIPLIALVIKFITMGNIQAGAWYGADGENYIIGVDGLLKDGFFSEEPKLSYWPAGYPILLWPFAELAISKFFYIISILQSIFFAYSTYFFTNKMAKSSLKNFAFWTSMIISFNPTLSLSSLAVGYEAPIASCFMMIAGIIWANVIPLVDKKFWLNVAYVGGWFALATFMQPRFLLIAIIIAVIWAMKAIGTKNRIRIAACVTAIMMVAPAIMIFRNMEVIDQSGQDLVFGPIGVLISYLWIITQIVFLFSGYRSLCKLGRDELFFARVLITPVLVSWLLALGTIGDHRFRMPTMSMSLALQIIAILAIRKKLNDRVG